VTLHERDARCGRRASRRGKDDLKGLQQIQNLFLNSNSDDAFLISLAKGK
jgi:hypothetical protein